ATEAIECLERAVTEIEKDESLSDSRRNALKRMLKDRIRVMQMPATADDAADARRQTKGDDEEARLTDRQKVPCGGHKKTAKHHWCRRNRRTGWASRRSCNGDGQSTCC